MSNNPFNHDESSFDDWLFHELAEAENMKAESETKLARFYCLAEVLARKHLEWHGYLSVLRQLEIWKQTHDV